MKGRGYWDYCIISGLSSFGESKPSGRNSGFTCPHFAQANVFNGMTPSSDAPINSFETWRNTYAGKNTSQPHFSHLIGVVCDSWLPNSKSFMFFSIKKETAQESSMY